MNIRREVKHDHVPIRSLHQKAFRGDGEACLVDALREAGALTVSLVAEDQGRVMGHLALSPRQRKPFQAVTLGLGPMAVLPERQRQGTGSALVEAAIREAKRTGAGGLFVMGHPEYYPRFDFEPAQERGIQCVYDVPPEAFMALELSPDGLSGYTGVVHYRNVFGMLDA